MVNNILKRLNPASTQDILIEGSFAANSVLCGLLATLNPDRKVRIQHGGNGVTAYAQRWEEQLVTQD